MELYEFFSFYVPGYKFMPKFKKKLWDGKIRLYDYNNKQIFCGLFDYIVKFCADRGVPYVLVNNAEYGNPGAKNPNVLWDLQTPISINARKIEPKDYQWNAVNHALQNKNALILSPTGSGKSLIIYMIARWMLQHTDKKVLVIVPTTSLVEQLYKDFEDYSGLDNSFSVADSVHRIFSGHDKNPGDRRIVVSTWQSIYNLPKPWFQVFGCVIGDEAHGFKAGSLQSIMSKSTEAEYRIGTTGTLDGTKTHKLVLEGVFGPVYHATKTAELMKKGSLAELNISVILLKHPRGAYKGKKYQEEIDYIVACEERNRFIANLTVDLTGNTLVLFQYVEKHGKPLYELICARASVPEDVFYVSGETNVESRESVRQIVETKNNSITVASMGCFSTGINIRNIHNIVFAAPSKSQVRVLQSIGRGLRKSDDGRPTHLYDIADSLRYTVEHAKERIKIYSQEKFKYKIYEVKLNGKSS